MPTSVDALLTRICSDGVSRLLLDVQQRYSLVSLEPRMMPVTRREVSQIDDHRTLWNFLVIGNSAGEFIAERALDGGLRLPAFACEARRLWNWSDWPRLLQFLHARVQHDFGVELLVPEPVASFSLTFTTGIQNRRIEALVWVAQHSGRLRPRSGLTATVVSQPQQLDLPHDQHLVAIAIPTLAQRPAFPLAELDAAAAEAHPGVVRHGKRLARSLLRWTPQPQRSWVFDQLGELGIGAGSRVLDLACGDDTLPSEIRQKFGAQVAVNDLLLTNAISAVQRDRQLELFNHDVRVFPVTMPFDVVILKNLLHHLRAADDHHQLHSVLRRIARTALIVEIADPSASVLHRWLHERIYTDDVNADGHAFLDVPSLTRLVTSLSAQTPDPPVRKVFTARGSYLLARLDF
jgi:SAM-dependent methyltransferase